MINAFEITIEFHSTCNKEASNLKYNTNAKSLLSLEIFTL